MMDALQPGVDEIMWSASTGGGGPIDKYIAECMKVVSSVDGLVRKMQDNVSKIRNTMQSWTKPLYERKKTMEPDSVVNMHGATV